MPNGIVVLMDEDVEAYINGTLEFIYPRMRKSSDFSYFSY